VRSFRDLTPAEAERHGFKRQELPTLKFAGTDLATEDDKLALTYTRNTRRWSSTYVENDDYQSANPAPIPAPVRRRPLFVPPKRCDHWRNGVSRDWCDYCVTVRNRPDPVPKYYGTPVSFQE
jgi:hypothetical protein